MIQIHNNLVLTSINKIVHLRTCGYWYIVTDKGAAHTAFRTKAALLAWLSAINLSVDGDIPEVDPFTVTHFIIKGEYKSTYQSYSGTNAYKPFYCLNNGRYRQGKAVTDDNGIVTLYMTNINLPEFEFDYFETSKLIDSGVFFIGYKPVVDTAFHDRDDVPNETCDHCGNFAGLETSPEGNSCIKCGSWVCNSCTDYKSGFVCKKCSSNNVLTELEDIKKVYEFTTKGQWALQDAPYSLVSTVNEYCPIILEGVASVNEGISEENCVENLAFSAKIHNIFPALIEEIARLQSIEAEYFKLKSHAESLDVLLEINSKALLNLVDNPSLIEGTERLQLMEAELQRVKNRADKYESLLDKSSELMKCLVEKCRKVHQVFDDANCINQSEDIISSIWVSINN
ncbi:hypothetical protein [Methylomonas sp. AM2-LC]|uniref:hypothetical protein n=1 Tax=Methylomonas sp. AM2-LC TaxID=3153301 RepID=UPI0032676005